MVGAALSVIGMGGVVLGILVWQEGGESVVLIIVRRGRLGGVGVVARQAQARRLRDLDRS